MTKSSLDVGGWPSDKCLTVVDEKAKSGHFMTLDASQWRWDVTLHIINLPSKQTLKLCSLYLFSRQTFIIIMLDLEQRIVLAASILNWSILAPANWSIHRSIRAYFQNYLQRRIVPSLLGLRTLTCANSMKVSTTSSILL